jgi:type I restriction enzyme M protein
VTRSLRGGSGSELPLGNDHSDLLKELWEAAVRLRGSIEPADYKRYVLPIIFLRFLSRRFEETRKELEALLDDPTSEYHTTMDAHRRAVLEDPDEYRSRGAFVVPAEARWDALVEAARRDDLKSHLDDVLQALEDAYPDKLRGLLPRIYAGSNLDTEDLRGLLNIFSRSIFSQGPGGEDLIGKVYEYFIGQFADSEGKRGGEYFTPASIVRTLVAMLEPSEGVVFDPCCGSGGMFVQSDVFTGHSHRLSFVGQESKDFTYRLCRMNLFIHGIDGNITLGNSYFDDKHAELKADYVLANPPFNDGAKSREGWGADKISQKDTRLTVGTERMLLAVRNANTMWILHFFHHLKPGGTAGFVMATGELANAELARAGVRRALVENDVVDCVVSLSGQLFANTQIPCSLWFLSRSREGTYSHRRRSGEVLFVDARELGAMIPGSRKQKQLSGDDIETIAKLYRQFKSDSPPPEQQGLVRVASIEEIRAQRYVLAPGRYVGTPDDEEEDVPLSEVLPELSTAILDGIAEGEALDAEIRRLVAGLLDVE